MEITAETNNVLTDMYHMGHINIEEYRDELDEALFFAAVTINVKRMKECCG